MLSENSCPTHPMKRWRTFGEYLIGHQIESKYKITSNPTSLLFPHKCEMILAHYSNRAAPMRGFPGGSDGKASACNAGDPGLIPGSGRSPGEGNGNPLQYSCLKNSIDGGAWWATVHGIVKSRTRLRDFTFIFTCPPTLARIAFNFPNVTCSLLPPGLRICYSF